MDSSKVVDDMFR